jgi:conjugal transfer pilus assembly protein TraF
MRPSEANVRRYMELESQVVARASYFADVAQRVAWATPQLDPTLQGRPVNAKALEVFDQAELVDRSRAIADLGKDHVLFFFIARTVRTAMPSRRPGSLPGATRHPGRRHQRGRWSMPSFPNARPDNGIATTLKVSQVPAVFLAQPFTGKITPIGFGVLSESQLLERIATCPLRKPRPCCPTTQGLALPQEAP